MFIQALLVTAATLTAAPQQADHMVATPMAAPQLTQQADRQSPDAAVVVVPADAGAIVAPGVAPLGPRPAPFIWTPATAPAPIGVSQPSSVMAPEGANHVIAISTLSLVLGIIILVLLIK